MKARTALSYVVGFLAISGIGGSIFFFTHEPNNEGFAQYPNITLLHVLPGAFYLLLAPFQFSKNIRNKSLNYHRWSGRILVSIGLVVGAAALFLGLVSLEHAPRCPPAMTLKRRSHELRTNQLVRPKKRLTHGSAPHPQI